MNFDNQFFDICNQRRFHHVRLVAIKHDCWGESMLCIDLQNLMEFLFIYFACDLLYKDTSHYP